jgi:hypothetical protein
MFAAIDTSIFLSLTQPSNRVAGLRVFPGPGLALLDMVSRTRLLSWLVVRYMTVCSYKEQMAAVQGPSFTILR